MSYGQGRSADQNRVQNEFYLSELLFTKPMSHNRDVLYGKFRNCECAIITTFCGKLSTVMPKYIPCFYE